VIGQEMERNVEERCVTTLKATVSFRAEKHNTHPRTFSGRQVPRLKKWREFEKKFKKLICYRGSPTKERYFIKAS